MSRLRLKCGGRKRRKALFGADGAIQAAATLAAAGIGATATALSAKKQSEAMIKNAETQAKSLESQNENNTNLQKESINFTRQQNQEARQQQQDIQMTLQMMAGQDNMMNRMEANKVAFKYGGSKRKHKLKEAIPFYGGANQFKVLDGGGVIPINVDPNGYGLYEIYGNDHKHYHKTRGGKYKSGVGIKFADGDVVEGEGNQNTNKGEKLFVTPNDAMFISKHSIDGFNPSDAVEAGLHPEIAFNIQEQLKQINGIEDDGTRKKQYGGQQLLSYPTNISPYYNSNAMALAGLSNKAKCGKRVSIRRKAKQGTGTTSFAGNTTMSYKDYDNIFRGIAGTTLKGYTQGLYPNGYSPISAMPGYQRSPRTSYPTFSQINKFPIDPYLVNQDGLATDYQNWINSPNNIGSSMTMGEYYQTYRPQNYGQDTNAIGDYGDVVVTAKAPNVDTTELVGKPGEPAKVPINTTYTQAKSPSWWDKHGGAAINAAANIIGSGLGIGANLYAGNIMNKAYQRASDIMGRAYDQLQTIDEDFINRSDYMAPKSLAVIRNADTNINPQLERIRRNAMAEEREINRNTLSSAARQQRLAAAKDRMMQSSSEQYAFKHNEDEKIRQANAERITQVAKDNADREIQAIKDYTAARLSLKQYNNDIINQRITGKAQAQADALSQGAAAKASAWQASGATLANALAASGQGFANSYEANRKAKQEAAYALAGMDDRRQAMYAIRSGDIEGAQVIFDKIMSDLANPSLSEQTRGQLIAEANYIKNMSRGKIKGQIPEK